MRACDNVQNLKITCDDMLQPLFALMVTDDLQSGQTAYARIAVRKHSALAFLPVHPAVAVTQSVKECEHLWVSLQG